MSHLPQYCCAIIHQQSGIILMEQRPLGIQFAAGRLCCFGGSRNHNESPLNCIQRELQEELSWSPAPQSLRHVHTLHRGTQCIAWFYECTLDVALSTLSCEADRSMVLVKLQERHQFPVSDWHRLVLDNYLGNITKSDLLKNHE